MLPGSEGQVLALLQTARSVLWFGVSECAHDLVCARAWTYMHMCVHSFVCPLCLCVCVVPECIYVGMCILYINVVCLCVHVCRDVCLCVCMYCVCVSLRVYVWVCKCVQVCIKVI